MNYGVDEPGKPTMWLDPWQGVYASHPWSRVGDEILGKGGWLVAANRGYAGGYRSYAESWTARLKWDTNVRAGPSTRYGIVGLAPANDRTELTRFTDDGQAIAESAPKEKRWHYTSEYGGWIYNGGLTDWAQV